MNNKRPVAIDHTHEPSAPTYDGFQSKDDKALIDLLRVDKVKYDNALLTTKEPTGFTNNSAITVTYNSTTRKVTLSGTFDAYYKGVRIRELIDGWTSSAHDTPQAVYYLYYCDSGFVFSTTPWDFSCLMICFVQYNSHQIGVREVHGFMPNGVHKELHNVIGAYLVSGGDLSGYVVGSTVAAERRPLISNLVIADEDLDSTVLALSSASYTQRYLTGSAVRSFNTAQAEIVPVSGSQPYYNLNTGGTWSQALFANNSYGAIFVVGVPTTNDAGSQVYRFMFVQPQLNSASLTEIQALTPNSLVHGVAASLVSEFVFFAKIIIRYTGGNWSITSVEKLTGTKVAQTSTAAGALTTVTHDTTLTGEGTTASPLSVLNTDVEIVKQSSGNLVPWSQYNFEIGTIASATGANITGNAIRMINQEAISPSTSYFFDISIGLDPSITNIFYYDSGGAYISTTAITSKTLLITTPSNAAFFRIRTYKVGGASWSLSEMENYYVGIFYPNPLKTVNSNSLLGSGDVAIAATVPDPLTLGRIRLTDTTDASLTSTDHAFQSGLTSGLNIIMDDNEIMARNNGNASELILNQDGGIVSMGKLSSYGATTNPTVYGNPIVEKGVTGSVYWTKFYDGTMLVFASASASLACSTAMGAGGGYRTAGQTLNLPESFVDTNYKVVVSPDTAYFNIGGGGRASTASALTWFLTSVSSDATARTRVAQIMAQGRWY